MKKYLNLLLGLVVVVLFAATFFGTNSTNNLQANADAVVGTAGVGDECNVHAQDASHTCSAGLVCVPQNDNSEGNGKCQTAATPTPTPTTTPGKHKACVENACVQVDGSGDNTCNNDKDCEAATPSPTPTPGEEQHYACVENSCQLVNGVGDNTCESNSDCQQTVTPTPTVPPAGHGDGLSDGGSSCPSCTQAPHQSVLGASTGPQVLGLSTTSGEESALPLVQLFGAFISSVAGFKFLKKNA